jgi:hypothetical protein
MTHGWKGDTSKRPDLSLNTSLNVAQVSGLTFQVLLIEGRRESMIREVLAAPR